MYPPQENVDYIKCDNPENLKEIISKINEKEWRNK